MVHSALTSLHLDNIMILNRGGHLNNKLAHSHNSQSDIPVGQQRRKAAPQNKPLLDLSCTQGTVLDRGGSPRPCRESKYENLSKYDQFRCVCSYSLTSSGQIWQVYHCYKSFVINLYISANKQKISPGALPEWEPRFCNLVKPLQVVSRGTSALSLGSASASVRKYNRVSANKKFAKIVFTFLHKLPGPLFFWTVHIRVCSHQRDTRS